MTFGAILYSLWLFHDHFHFQCFLVSVGNLLLSVVSYKHEKDRIPQTLQTNFHDFVYDSFIISHDHLSAQILHLQHFAEKAGKCGLSKLMLYQMSAKNAQIL